MLYLDNRFMEVALPIIEHEEYQQMRYIKHHDESVFEHSLKVVNATLKLYHIPVKK